MFREKLVIKPPDKLKCCFDNITYITHDHGYHKADIVIP